MNSSMSPIEVLSTKTPDVEDRHLRILLRHPNHYPMHHCQVEHGQEQGCDMKPDTEDQAERCRDLHDHSRGLRPGKEHRPVERSVDRVPLWGIHLPATP